MFKTDINGYKLIFTIVKKGLGGKVVRAAKSAGAEGATVLFGLGTAPPGSFTFWGMEMEPSKEIILTMVPEHQKESVFTAIRRIAKLHKPGTGISIIVDMLKLAGCIHLGKEIFSTNKNQIERTTMNDKEVFNLIVTIVNKGYSGEVIKASREAGAEGGTIMNGRGSGIHETGSLFSLHIEPEKEIVLTLVNQSICDNVLRTIIDKTHLDEPGKGIAFVIPVEEAAGIAHRNS